MTLSRAGLDFVVCCGYLLPMVDIAFESISPPLKRDADGVVRVGGTRVPLDTIARAFNNGSTAEEIAQQFPSLLLADIYTAISYILNNPADVEAYCQDRQATRASAQTSSESRFTPSGIRERLMNRRNQG